jgi:type I restriction enzyme S subunit
VTHGDILISMIGVNRGMACVVDDHRIFSIKNVGLIKKALNINPLYLLFYLKSHTAKKYIESESRGGAQPFIGLTKLRAFPVLLASPEEQEEVVSKLTLIEARTENLVLIYETKLKSLEELKKSLLQKAFSDELTKTEGHAA